MKNLVLELGEFNEDELTEIFASMWFGMDLDFKGFQLLNASDREKDSSQFASRNGLRYSILSKIASHFKGTDKYDDMQQILDSAGEIMLVARGGQDDRRGASEAT